MSDFSARGRTGGEYVCHVSTSAIDGDGFPTFRSPRIVQISVFLPKTSIRLRKAFVSTRQTPWRPYGDVLPVTISPEALTSFIVE